VQSGESFLGRGGYRRFLCGVRVCGACRVCIRELAGGGLGS